MFLVRFFFFTSIGLLLLATHAAAAQYSFINIADTRGPFDGFGYGLIGVAVSESGTVAFIGHQGDVAATYVGSGGAVQQIVPDLSPPPGFQIIGYYALNESGAAAVKVVGQNFEQKIQLYDASGTRTIAHAADGGELLGFPAIHNSGAVVFSTRFFSDPNPTQVALMQWSNGTTTTLVEVTEGFYSIENNLVAINESGHVAFSGRYDPGGVWTIYCTDGTALTPIAGPFDDVLSLAINDSGAVAIHRLLESGGEGIFVAGGGPLTTVAIADPTTPFSEIQTDIDINDQGVVAFTARLWNGSYGIYAGGDPINDKVIEIGDLLFGQPVSGLGRPHLNNRGDVAFWFDVRDPRDPSGYWSGIALAVKEQSLPGDNNGDGAVDAADYVVWRTTDGTLAGYDTWRANFGQTAGGGAGATAASSHAAVPEPSGVFLAPLALYFCTRLRTNHWSET
jgi:hypothetical protein